MIPVRLVDFMELLIYNHTGCTVSIKAVKSFIKRGYSSSSSSSKMHTNMSRNWVTLKRLQSKKKAKYWQYWKK